MSLASNLRPDKNIDVSRLVATMKAAGAQLPSVRLLEDLRSVPLLGAVMTLNEIAHELLLPDGELFLANFVGAPQIWRGRVDSRSWTQVPFAPGRPVWTAEVSFERCPRDAYALSVREFALVDRGRALVDGHRMYALLESPESVLLEQLLPYTRPLKQALSSAGITAARYADLFCLQRVRHEEIHHCRDHIYLEAIAAPGLSIEARRANLLALIRPGSVFYEYVEEIESPREIEELRAGVSEFCAHLSGVLQEMHGFNAHGEHLLAFTAFLDFMLTTSIRQQTGEDPTASPDHLPYAQVGRVLWAALNQLGVSDHDELLSLITTPGGAPGKRAEEVLSAAFDLYFLSPEEKRSRLT